MRSFSVEVYKFDVSRRSYTNTETNEMVEMMDMKTATTEGKELDIQKDKDKLKRSQSGMYDIQNSVFEQGGKFKEVDNEPKKNPRKKSYKEAHVPDSNGIHRFVPDTKRRWYNQHTRNEIQLWEDLARVFIEQCKHITDIE
ncbi:hypothetical protein GQ457_01G023140 [Hibiscus cannabinus]